ncbi:MAG: bifunctional folylpolyglutamate synthase/dihydrofolate synthase [Phycisphaerales bacterium]|nr:bifunctional folylpolyglutamate synthase/dihydrofolate synthase [Phycisphaerales bacterium]
MERMRAVANPSAMFKLDRMRALLAAMGDPHEQVKCVHVAGTVGKGSTCAMISSMLSECGYTVGVYTSPHLVDLRERITINGALISKHDVTEGLRVVQAAAAKAKVDPTFFEAMTALAFKHFAEQAVDVAVIEVGLGGRLDSTNVITPLVSVVTTIDFDHTKLLGNTLSAIAKEKAGIFKKGVPALIFDATSDVNGAFVEVAEKVGADLRIVNKDIEFSSRFCATSDLGPHTRICLYTKTTRLEHLPVPLPGEHQALNCALAIAAVDVLKGAGFSCPDEKVTAGLSKVRVPGRMELVSDRPRILVDGAHNPISVSTLMRCVGAHVPYDSMVCVFGCCIDKDVEAMLDRVNLGADKVIFTRASGNPRAADPHELQRRFQERGSGKMSQVARTVGEAIELASRATSRDDLICVTGSFYVCGDALRYIAERRERQAAVAAQ